jgi:hypothetical protein
MVHKAFDIILPKSRTDNPGNGTARFLSLPLIVQGANEKVPQFIIQLKSIYSKNFCFIEETYLLKIVLNIAGMHK